jgi:hypothetical protein
MPETGCDQAMQLLNFVFDTALILNDGHEIRDRLEAGEDPAEVLIDQGLKFGRLRGRRAASIERVARNWPPLHMEAVASVVTWALSKLDSSERVRITWKGDAEYPETVTRFELRENHLQIEFLHPPAAMSLPAQAS